MKTATQIKFRQLGILMLLWLFFGFVIAIYDHLQLHTYYSLGPSTAYSFWNSVVRNMVPGFIGALLGGSLLVFYVNEKFRDRPYGHTLLFVAVSFILIVLFITLVMGMVIVPRQTAKPLSHPETHKAFWDFVTDPYPLKNALVWAFIVEFTQLMLQINSKFGHRTFWNILRGRYNTPKEEKRIFMFLDLDDSTTLAETLGNERYHSLLKDFFADITDPIIDSKGNIYQYVGDEVVVAWDYKEGTEAQHCLKCFFEIKEVMALKSNYYRERYGEVPSFKAGFHSGNVVAGEVGIVKRDITYSGDVLNTTARILGKCSELKEEILISSDLLSILDLTQEYRSRLLGSVYLKGKAKEISIHSLSMF
ncbi:adenylate/guanylate cyclase domain-containing protein [Flagellimonas olearia]|uniref:Adenylate/guanylate cyclase domain-containing protein n=1 Tax=Flagellimonas olearia TaxID=552546 RepID=A0A6I1E366_9FLAO|nr:adenylate/guanylate cyclase domain-containing protein [Allomuricauda olearia]KAB7530370.1 adenylate/guanylate cyclase domain-containing protein [Allomuricauda olearia]